MEKFIELHTISKEHVEKENNIEESQLAKTKQKGKHWMSENIIQNNKAYTRPGSISFLLFGKQPSIQSINIKLGKFGEFLSKELIKLNSNLELLKCGIQYINNKKKKDIDLIFLDKDKKIIYYFELKGNIDLDTEKSDATIDKCKLIDGFLKKKYPDYLINVGILNWSVFDRKNLTAGVPKIKIFEKGGIKVCHMGDFLQIIGVSWDENDYYSYFREIGSMIRKL